MLIRVYPDKNEVRVMSEHYTFEPYPKTGEESIMIYDSLEFASHAANRVNRCIRNMERSRDDLAKVVRVNSIKEIDKIIEAMSTI